MIKLKKGSVQIFIRKAPTLIIEGNKLILSLRFSYKSKYHKKYHHVIYTDVLVKTSNKNDNFLIRY